VESAEARSGIIQIRAVVVNTFFSFFSPDAEAFISGDTTAHRRRAF